MFNLCAAKHHKRAELINPYGQFFVLPIRVVLTALDFPDFTPYSKKLPLTEIIFILTERRSLPENP